MQTQAEDVVTRMQPRLPQALALHRGMGQTEWGEEKDDKALVRHACCESVKRIVVMEAVEVQVIVRVMMITQNSSNAL